MAIERFFGAAGIEFDVRWTADGVPVVLHDATLDRTTTGTGPVRSCTCTGLQSLYLLDGRRQPTRWVVPTMHDVIARFGHRARLFVEVKTDDSPSPEARGREIARALRSANLPCGPLLLSFAPQALIGARETWNTLDTCLLAEPSHSSLGSCPSNLVAEGKDAGASAIGIPDTVVSKVLVRLAHASGLCVYSWGNLEQHVIESRRTSSLGAAGQPLVGICGRHKAQPDNRRNKLLATVKLVDKQAKRCARWR